MPEYYFKTKEFGVSDEGIHLLRSEYNYETLTYHDIVGSIIEYGKEINNWLLALLIGIGMVGFALFYTLRLLNIIGNAEVHVIYIEEIIVPLFPFLIGGYFIYSSTSTGIILKVKTASKFKRLSLGELKDTSKLEEFLTLLKGKLQSKLSIQI